MLLANLNGKEHLRHRAVSLRQHGFLVIYLLCCVSIEFESYLLITQRFAALTTIWAQSTLLTPISSLCYVMLWWNREIISSSILRTCTPIRILGGSFCTPPYWVCDVSHAGSLKYCILHKIYPYRYYNKGLWCHNRYQWKKNYFVRTK